MTAATLTAPTTTLGGSSHPPPPQDLLARVSSFLPTIRAANAALFAADNGEQQQADGRGTAVAVDTNLEAVLPGDSTSSSSEDEDDASASSTTSSSESEDGAGSESEEDRVATDPATNAASCRGDDGDKKRVSRMRRKRKNTTPTIVMDLQLGSFQDNPAMALVAHHDQSDEECDGEEPKDKRILEPQSGAEAAMRKFLSTKTVPTGKKPKGPLITEVGP